MKMKLMLVPIFILFFFCSMIHAQGLYVGANYHPHDDKNIEKIKTDIQLMKDAGFNVVRMGHLAWDSYEPSEGVFRLTIPIWLKLSCLLKAMQQAA